MELERLNVQLRADIRGFMSGMAKAGGQLKAFGAGIEMHSASLMRFGRNMTIAGGAVLAGLGIAAKGAIDFQKQMAFVNTMLTDATRDFLPKYAEAAKDMATATGASLESITRGYYDVLSAQIDASEATEFMTAANLAAVGGFTEVDTAVSAMLTLMKTYSSELKDATDASDFMHAVVERGRITFDEFAANIGKVAGLAAQTGVSLNDLGVSVAAITRGGLKAELAMTAVRGILRSFLKPSEQGKIAASELGFELSKAGLKADGLTGILGKLKNATQEQLVAIAPNIRGLTGFSIALGQVTQLGTDFDAMLNRTGLSQEKFQIAQETTSQQLKILAGNWKVLSIELGEIFLPTINKVVQGAIVLLQSMREWSKEHPVLTKYIMGTVAALGILLLAGGPILMLFTKLAGGIKLLVSGAIALKGGLIALASGGFNPVILAVGALIAILGVAISKWMEYKNAVDQQMKSQQGVAEVHKKLAEEHARDIESMMHGEVELTNAQKARLAIIKGEQTALMERIAVAEQDKQITKEESDEIYGMSTALTERMNIIKQEVGFRREMASAVENQAGAVAQSASTFDIETNAINQNIGAMRMRQESANESLAIEENISQRRSAAFEAEAAMIEFRRNQTIEAAREKWSAEVEIMEATIAKINENYDSMLAQAREKDEQRRIEEEARAREKEQNITDTFHQYEQEKEQTKTQSVERDLLLRDYAEKQELGQMQRKVGANAEYYRDVGDLAKDRYDLETNYMIQSYRVVDDTVNKSFDNTMEKLEELKQMSEDVADISIPSARGRAGVSIGGGGAISIGGAGSTRAVSARVAEGVLAVGAGRAGGPTLPGVLAAGPGIEESAAKGVLAAGATMRAGGFTRIPELAASKSYYKTVADSVARVAANMAARVSASGGYQHGTANVPTTGLYQLHAGEQIVPRPIGGSDREVTIINAFGDNFIAQAIADNPGAIVNAVTENMLINGTLKRILKGE